MSIRPFALFLGISMLFATACQNNTSETSTSEQPPIETVSNTQSDMQAFHVVPSATTIQWEGYKPAMGVTHTGTVEVQEGQLFVEDEMLKGGKFIIDFTTIKDTDLEGDAKAKLEAHLKGTAEGKEDDFFNVEAYPTGLFEITKTTALTGDAEANTMIYGNLTIKDVTRNIGFMANVRIKDGVVTATTPMFKIDRTEFGIQVLSQKFFDNLQDNFVADEFGLRINLRAESGKDI